MEHSIAVNCPICKKESSFYISTKALMHKTNDELYIFNICNNCEAVFLTNPVTPERLEHYYTENYLPYKGPSAWGRYSSFVVSSQKKLDLRRVYFVKKYLKKKQLYPYCFRCRMWQSEFFKFFRTELKSKLYWD